MNSFSAFHSKFLAHRLTPRGSDEVALAKTLNAARVDLNPHQVDAALFALEPPIPRGAVLADEVGLGKTIEAALVIAQKWAERKRKILLIVPASLRKQWSQELSEKFGLPSVILDSGAWKAALKGGTPHPLDIGDKIVITSYEFAAMKADAVRAVAWDLVVFDEAHRLRNVYRKGASQRAKALRDALKSRFKLLLTATPLQNSLMELFGLVSMIDEQVFGDEKSFRTNYAGRAPTPAALEMLRDRLKPICRRSLRKDVQEAGHIKYTRRIPSTIEFEPKPDEVSLYEDLSAFLARKDTVAFGGKPNQLIVLVVRKILGSSTFAVSETLRAIIERLESLQALLPENLSDLDTVDELVEEWADDNDVGDGDDGEPIDPVKLAAEIVELKGYLVRAVGIRANAKGQQLVSVLGRLLDEAVGKGAKRKAVIFTESVRTQKYLAELLAEHGYAGEIALLNGSNADAESRQIFADWKQRHEGTDAVSRSKTADMKAAIVDAFREEKTILIATESGAEGINLQFCSLLINFDLPWNPQRVEQRIGRCHRYGQKIDVLVVNFLNLKNRAEARILQLLREKFRLFDGVFGTSDEVLGSIENGTDFERRIFEIFQTARTADEVDAAFDELTAELAPQIDQDMLDARGKLIGTFDQDVVGRLRTRKGDIEHVMDEFERRLLTLVRAELPEVEVVCNDNEPPRFVHEGATYTTAWPLADEKGWKFLRLAEGTLAQSLVDRARARDLEPAELAFDYSGYDQTGGALVDVRGLIGKSGWLRVSRLTLTTAEQEVEHLLCAAATDDGEQVLPETVDRLFLVPGAAGARPSTPEPAEDLARHEASEKERRIQEANDANSEYLLAETDKLEAYASDLDQASKTEVTELEAQITEKKREMRSMSLTVAEKIEAQRAIKKLEGKRDDLVADQFTRRREIRRQNDELLDRIQDSLQIEPKVEPLFTIRWSVKS